MTLQTYSETPLSARLNPHLRETFKQAEGRHFTDEELDLIVAECPHLAVTAAAARELRGRATALVARAVGEVISQYPFERLHEYSQAKCLRDVNYVVAYAGAAMLSQDHTWFDNKVLIWLKTILQSFDFPDRHKSSAGALFADPVLEENLARLPVKSRSIFHLYYRLKQEMQREIEPSLFSLLGPFLQQPIDTLTEPY